MKIIDVPEAVLELLGLKAGSDVWPAPEDLRQDLLPILKLRPEMLPTCLHAWIYDIAHRMQCPIEFVAAPALAMIGSVIGTACGIRPKQNDSWTEVANVWGGLIARPGQLKSPAIAEATRPLRVLNALAREQYEQDQLRATQEKVTRKMEAELLKRAIKRPDDHGQIAALVKLSTTPDDEPRARRYYTNDCTAEKLGELLSNSQRGILVLHDELTGLLEGFNRPGREGERAFYLAAWSGMSPHLVDRIGRGEIYIPRLCASIFGGIQPSRLERYVFESQTVGSDGFIERLQLLVYPDEPPLGPTVDQTPDEVQRERVGLIVKRLAMVDFLDHGALQDGDDGVPYFRFDSGDAQGMFLHWLEENERRIRAEDSPLMQQHLSKYRKLIPALSLIFHLVDMADRQVECGGPVGSTSLRMAIEWSTVLETHARRIYAMVGDFRMQAARALSQKLLAGQLSDGFSERDVQRKSWSSLVELEAVRAAITELEAGHWVRRVQSDKPRGVGRQPSPQYEINPAVIKLAQSNPTQPTQKVASASRKGPKGTIAR
jgi:putative DNA primase/helicase